MDKQQLTETIKAQVDSSNLSYGDIKDILQYLIALYSDKGNNLLNSTSIQEVAKQERIRY